MIGAGESRLNIWENAGSFGAAGTGEFCVCGLDLKLRVPRAAMGCAGAYMLYGRDGLRSRVARSRAVVGGRR